MGRLFFEDPSQILLPFPVYLVGLVAVMTIWAFRQPQGHAWHRRRYWLVGLLAWSYLTTIPTFSNALLHHMETSYATQQEPVQSKDSVIIVLASGYGRKGKDGYESRLDERGWERLFAAVKLWQRVGGKVLLVGGAVSTGADPIADTMAQVARRMGVPGDAIYLERESQNTYQNLLYVQRFISDFHHVSLVTSAVHMPRAMAVAEELRISVTPFPCDYLSNHNLGWRAWFPNNGAPRQLAAVIHEVVGLLYYRLRGWA